MDPLLSEYRQHALQYGIHTQEGNVDATNASLDRSHEAFLALVRQGKGDMLFDLYQDVEPWVQMAAAAHSLEISETRALEKLAQLAIAGLPHISTEAKYSIQGWKAGSLRFLPE